MPGPDPRFDPVRPYAIHRFPWMLAAIIGGSFKPPSRRQGRTYDLFAITIALTAAGCGEWGSRHNFPDLSRDQRQAVATLRANHFTVLHTSSEQPNLVERHRIDLQSDPEQTVAALLVLKSMVTRLDATNTPMKDHQFQRLTALSRLQSLILRSVPITDASMRTIATFADLNELNLWGTNVEGRRYSELVGLTRLNRLIIPMLDDETAREVAALSALATLTVDRAQLNEAGGAELAKLQLLRELELRSTTFGPKALARIASLPQLERLVLTQATLDDQQLAELCDAPQLRELDLFESSITDAAMEHVGRIAMLEQLRIGNTAVGDLGLKHLTALRNLKRIRFGGSKSTFEGRRALKQDLPDVTFVEY